jgi:hypothetical protein
MGRSFHRPQICGSPGHGLYIAHKLSARGVTQAVSTLHDKHSAAARDEVERVGNEGPAMREGAPASRRCERRLPPLPHRASHSAAPRGGARFHAARLCRGFRALPVLLHEVLDLVHAVGLGAVDGERVHEPRRRLEALPEVTLSRRFRIEQRSVHLRGEVDAWGRWKVIGGGGGGGRGRGPRAPAWMVRTGWFE